MKYGWSVLDTSVEGFVYVPREEEVEDRYRGPDDSGVIECVAPPPWLVVHAEADSVGLTSWPPGRLWRVSTLPPRTSEEAAQLKKLNAIFRPDAGHTRVSRVRVLEQVPVRVLFGDNGAAVEEVVDYASQLTRDEAETLDSSRRADAGSALARVGKRFLDSEVGRSIEPALLAAGLRSPVNAALHLIASLTRRQALSIDGDRAIVIVGEDGDGPEDELVAPWYGAGWALVEAAMALGAPQLSGGDAEVLLAAWNYRLR